MSFHSIHSDGMSVRVSYRGLPPCPIPVILISFFLLCFGLVGLELAWQQLAPKLADDWYMRFDWWWRILLYFAIFGAIPLGIAALGMRMIRSTMAESFRFLKKATWDSGRGEFSYVHSTLLGLINSRCTVSLSEIEAIEAYFEADEETEGLHPKPLVIALHGDMTHELELIPAKTIELADVNSLVFAIARLCNLTHCSQVSDQRNGVSVTRIHAHAKPTPYATEIPDTDSSARVFLFPRKSAFVAAAQGLAENLTTFAVALFLACVGAFFVWGAWAQGKRAEELNLLAEQIEKLGAEVTQSGLKIGEISIFGDGFLVEIEDPEFDDTDLGELIKKLEPVGYYGLDLSNTSVTNDGIKLLPQLLELKYLDLSDTLVNREIIPFLAKSNLGAIDLRRTPIRIEHIMDWHEFYALEVLLIDDENVTTDDIWKLNGIPRLEALLVNDRESTQRLLAREDTPKSSEDSDKLKRQQAIEALSAQIAGELRYYLN